MNKNDYVLIVQDPFTSFYEAELVQSFITLITALGKKPMLLPFKPNGKAQHVKGFLHEFKVTAKNGAEFLNKLTDINSPLVGLDASLVMCYRDEYKTILENNRGEFHVQLAHEWLQTQSFKSLSAKQKLTLNLHYCSHCTETTALPKDGKRMENNFTDIV
eukprot:UN07689